MHIFFIVLSIIGIIFLVDVVYFVCCAFGVASNLTYNICRPFGIPMSMIAGLIARVIEVFWGGMSVMYLISLLF